MTANLRRLVIPVVVSMAPSLQAGKRWQSGSHREAAKSHPSELPPQEDEVGNGLETRQPSALEPVRLRSRQYEQKQLRFRKSQKPRRLRSIKAGSRPGPATCVLSEFAEAVTPGSRAAVPATRS